RARGAGGRRGGSFRNASPTLCSSQGVSSTFQPPSKSRKADDVAAGLANVELRRYVESVVARRGHPGGPYGLFELVEIADRRHRDEQCGAVTRKVVCLVWTLGDDARGRLIHDLDAVLLQDREDELPI